VSEEITLRDYFAARAPAPRESDIEIRQANDRDRNPHNDSYKPKRRTRYEIIADLAWEYADAMLARKPNPTQGRQG